MPNEPANPLIIQGDRSILLDAHAPRAAEARAALIPFAELEKSPEHLHTYRITPLSLWNAASAGFTPEGIAATLEGFARYPVPQGVGKWIIETMGRFGKIRLVAAPPASAAVASSPVVSAGTVAQASASPVADDSAMEIPDAMDEQLLLIVSTPMIFRELSASRAMAKYLTPEPGAELTFRLALLDRGTVKQELLTLGWRVQDEAPLRDGDPLEIGLRETCSSG